MNEQPDCREIITFCQLLSVALRSGRPIPESLGQLGGQVADSAASRWAQDLVQKISEGHSLDEACREISDFDPVLARLMPLLGNNRLIKVLELYTGFLVNLERVRENLKSALFYPTVVIGLLLANLVQLNFGLFYHVYQQAATDGGALPLMLRILYFAEVDLWPVSLPLPFLMLVSFLFMARSMLAGQIDSHSLVARLARFGEALRLQETGRLQGVISLYLQAGFSLTRAVDNASKLATGPDAVSLAAVAKALGDGEDLAQSFELSCVMQNLATDRSDGAVVAEHLQFASESNYRHSFNLLKRISSEMTLVALLLTGLFVTLVTSSVFGSYYWVIWSIR